MSCRPPSRNPSPTAASEWRLTASHGQTNLPRAIDGNPGTRYTTGTSIAPGMWVRIELPETTRIGGLVLDAGSSKNDYPRGCVVEISTDGETWKTVARLKDSRTTKVRIDFGPQPAKFVRITQTGKHKLFWSIHDLQIFEEKRQRDSPRRVTRPWRRISSAMPRPQSLTAQSIPPGTTRSTPICGHRTDSCVPGDARRWRKRFHQPPHRRALDDLEMADADPTCERF